MGGQETAMITLRHAAERGHADHGWLNSFHTFSFADYYDPAHMGFRSLRVINEDRVQPGRGFGTHPHRDMEIISYVLEGGLAHKDSMGTGSVIRPGDVQRMSAGTGVTHSEFNASPDDLVHFLQIWLVPAKRGIAPSYEQKSFTRADKEGRLRLVASPDGREGSVTIHTDAALYAGVFGGGQRAELAIARGRHAWVHVARGKARINGHELSAGDAASLSDEAAVRVEGAGATAADETEVLVFDLA
jgi:redox-sensitive bicupin YhaK (pirin superfamily)